MRLVGQRYAAILSWVLAAWLVAASSAAAQSTGGSAGGGSWGSSGSSSSEDSSSSSSWGSSSGSSGVASSNSYEPSLGGQLLIAVAYFACLALLFYGFRWGMRRLEARGAIGVSMLQIAIDARSRRFVQAALAHIVGESDTKSAEGLARLLGGAARSLESARLAWIYCGAQRIDAMPPTEARRTHLRFANDARARFQTELVRAEKGHTTRVDAPEPVAHAHEGEGVVVVTLVVATQQRLPAIDPTKVAEIEQLLAQLSTLPAQKLVALELIWSPAAENDRMSTDELESRYPELTRLGAVGGRVFCAYCAGPYTAELSKCPHCGAPSASTAASESP